MVNQYSAQFTVTGVTSYPGTAQVSQGMIPGQVILQNRNDASIYFSFNGTDDHGQVQQGESINIETSQGCLYSKVWLRDAGDGTVAQVRVSLYV